METSSKASKATRQLVALLTASATLAIATLVTASTSTQVKQLDPLVVPRTAHAATALTDGRILITGGRDSAGNIVAVSEIFDPVTETSTASATLTTPRVDHTATLLADGRVLVAGGSDGNASLNSAEIFDPANPTAGFHVVAATMGAARTGHTATLLSNGTVLIAGGDTAGTAEIFDPTTETFSSALLTLATPRTGHTATLFSGDSVLLAGGGTGSMEWFSSTDQKFTIDPAKMSASRTGHFALELSDTRLLLFEGDTGNTVDAFNPSTDTITLTDTFDAPASSATLLANGNILVIRPDLVGLYSPDATDQSTAFTAFDETSVPGSSILPRSGQTAAQLSGDKKIFVAGGTNAQNLFMGAALFNPVRIWTDKDDYAPGDNVILSGSGWKPNENVYLYAVDDTTEAWTYGSTATADATGAFVVNPYFVVQLVQNGAHFSVSAVGAQSAMQADVKFTDNINFQGVTVLSQVGALTYGTAASATFQVTATYSGNGNIIGDPVTWSITSTLPAGVSSSFSPATSSFASPTSQLTLTTSPTTPAGNYSFTVQGKNAAGTTNTKNGTLVVGKANATVVVKPYAVTYDGNAHTATVTSITGVNGENGATVGTVNVSGTTHTNAGPGPSHTYSDTWTFTPTANYNNITSGNTITDEIDPADATIVVTAYHVTYTGTAHTATVTATGVGGANLSSSVNVSATTHTLAGDYPSDAWSFSNSNYNSQNGTVHDIIDKANATFTVTPYNVTYDGNAHTATVSSIIGVNGETGATVGTVNVSGTTHTSANNGVPYSDTWTFTPTANYNSIAATTITDTINRAQPAFSNLSNPQTISYGTATITVNGRLNAGTNLAPSGTGTVSVSTASATIGPFTGAQGSFSGTQVTTSAIPVGTYDITYSYGGDTNFMSATGVVTHGLTVTKATPTITWANPANITYGTALSATQLNATASVPGTFVYNPPTGTVLNAGNNQPLSVTFTPTDTTNYTTATATVFINVLQASPVITWANPADITYGTALSATQLNATANVGGTFLYSPAAGTVLNAGNNQPLSVTFTPTNTNYTTATATVFINVLQASPVITWANPADITSGTALSGTQLNATANVGGTFLYSPAAGTVLPVGNNQPLSVTFTPTDATDYSDAAATVYINVVSAATSTTVVSSQNPSAVGSSVSFTATVSSASGTPGGTVQFVIDGVNFGTPVTLSAGSATSSSTTSLTPGEHVVTAVYSGDSSFTGSTSPFLIQTVNNALTSIVVMPANPTINVTDTQQFTATGTFADGSSAILPGGGKWATGNSMGNAVRAPMAAAGDNGMLYFFGGQDSGGAENYVQIYDPATGAWASGSTTGFTARYQGAAVAPGDGLIYVIGGFGTSGPTAVVEAYDPGGNSWASKASMPHVSAASIAGAINGKIYVLTGNDGSPGASEFDVYDPALHTWSSLTPPAHAHATGAGGVIDGKLYVAGGYDVSTATNIVESYDPQTSTWTTVAAMPASLGELGGGVTDGILYVVGGLDSSSTPQASVYAFDGNSWSNLSASLSTGRRDIGVAALDGLLYAAGGYTSSNSNMLEVLDTDVVTWSSDNPSVATINANTGLATGASAGTAHITATSATYAVSGSTLLTVIQATPTVKVTDPMPTYDGNPHSAEATAYGVDGITPVSGSFTFTYDGNATAPTNAKTSYAVVATFTSSDPKYTGATGSGFLTIKQRPATVTADNKNKQYGDDNPALTATVTGTVTGDALNYSLSTTAMKLSNVGDYPITVTLGSNPNYTVTKTDGTLHISPKDASVTADNKNKQYGDDNPALTATVVGEVAGGDAINYSLSTTAVKLSNVGDYPITVTLGSNPNYNVTKTNGTLHVSPKNASVTADNKGKQYGDDNPALTATVVGEVAGGDVINYSLSTTALKFSNVGDYPITVKLGSNPNYNVTPTNGTLHISPRPAAVTADNKMKFYGDDNPTLTATVTGTVNGDVLNYTLGTTALKYSNVGNYAIRVTLGSNPNYSVTPANGILAINPRPATVTADNKSKTYGDDNPALTATVAGTVNGDVLNYTLSTTALKFSNVGNYPITVTLGSNPNYSVTPYNGTLTIGKAHLTVNADAKSVQYSDPLRTLAATISGFLAPGESEASLRASGDLSGNASFTTSGITFYSTTGVSNAPGTYTNAIIPSVGTLTATNYDFTTFNKGTLTVTQEDARAYYTGPTFVNTSTPSGSTATVTLSATIKDITPVDPTASPPNPDNYPGIITNAKVTFYIVETNTTIPNVPVGLVNVGDSTVGTATANWNATITPPSQTFTVRVIVSGYYTRNSSDDDTIITVAQPPAAGSITGGGYLLMSTPTTSAGLYPAGAGTKNNFGFNVQNTKTGVKGNINTIIRNNGHVYQVKGNSMTSLTTNPITSTTGTAFFNGKANIQDITNPNAQPISIDGNATLQVSMTDNGEPGSNDTISITVFSKSGGVWFTSNWNGTNYVEQKLGGGNLQVR